MMYLCLIYDEEKKLAGLPKSENDAFMGDTAHPSSAADRS